ncbi:hypothetical protein [Arthrobacter sp. AQ5-05]|uniref:hypothetical protein n=1 Tax=Arthrobacter sp. AQ5-05 TaxID=2184581 RepID=UPI0011BEA2FD|nr:hypothetical protein [Arthrobacter sp. AQ5-05]
MRFISWTMATLLITSLSFGTVPATASPSSMTAVSSLAPAGIPVAKKTLQTRITAQPRSTTVYVADRPKFTARATGSSLRYQWQSKRPGSKWKNVAGAAARKATYTAPAAKSSQSKTKYRVVVTGKRSKVTSSTATLTVKKWLKPRISKLSTTTIGRLEKSTITLTGTNLHRIKVGDFAGAYSAKIVSSSSTSAKLVINGGGSGFLSLRIENPAGSQMLQFRQHWRMAPSVRNHEREKANRLDATFKPWPAAVNATATKQLKIIRSTVWESEMDDAMRLLGFSGKYASAYRLWKEKDQLAKNLIANQHRWWNGAQWKDAYDQATSARDYYADEMAFQLRLIRIYT